MPIQANEQAPDKVAQPLIGCREIIDRNRKGRGRVLFSGGNTLDLFISYRKAHPNLDLSSLSVIFYENEQEVEISDVSLSWIDDLKGRKLIDKWKGILFRRVADDLGERATPLAIKLDLELVCGEEEAQQSE